MKTNLVNVSHLISCSLKKQLIKHSRTPEYQQTDYTQEEQEDGLQTIIRHMIQVYGYEKTKNAFIKTFVSHTLLKNINRR